MSCAPNQQERLDARRTLEHRIAVRSLDTNSFRNLPRAVCRRTNKPDDFERGGDTVVQLQGDRGGSSDPESPRRAFCDRQGQRFLQWNAFTVSRRKQQEHEHRASHRARPLTASKAASSESPVTIPFWATASAVTTVAIPRFRNT